MPGTWIEQWTRDLQLLVRKEMPGILIQEARGRENRVSRVAVKSHICLLEEQASSEYTAVVSLPSSAGRYLLFLK